MTLTARAMERSIRSATAHAKTRASRTVDPVDAEAVICLMHYAYFGIERSQGELDDEGEEEDGGDHGGNGEDGEMQMQESDPEVNYKLLVSSLAR